MHNSWPDVPTLVIIDRVIDQHWCTWPWLRNLVLEECFVIINIAYRNTQPWRQYLNKYCICLHCNQNLRKSIWLVCKLKMWSLFGKARYAWWRRVCVIRDMQPLVGPVGRGEVGGGCGSCLYSSFLVCAENMEWVFSTHFINMGVVF